MNNSYVSVLFLSHGIFFLVVLLISFLSFFKAIKLYPFLVYSGKHSLELYLVHLFIYHTIILVYYNQLTGALVFITAFVLSYASSYFVYLIRIIAFPFTERTLNVRFVNV